MQKRLTVNRKPSDPKETLSKNPLSPVLPVSTVPFLFTKRLECGMKFGSKHVWQK